jgi:hypothetical protein
MAQHIEIRHEHAPAILKKIGASIEKEVARGLSKCSMKWEYVGDNTWLTNRYIGKGIVYGDTRGTFEVSVEGKVARNIYLVA